MTGIESEKLHDLLGDAHTGRIRIPEFQRELCLQDGWVRSLLASISLNYPIGAVMLLEAAELRFGSRSVPGAPASRTPPQRLVIDGQYRLAALYQALHPGSRPRRRYYLDLDGLDRDVPRDQVIVSRAGRDPVEGPLFPLWLAFAADTDRYGVPAGVLRAFREYVVPVIVLDADTARWTVRVHGGPDGPALSDRYFADSGGPQGFFGPPVGPPPGRRRRR